MFNPLNQNYNIEANLWKVLRAIPSGKGKIICTENAVKVEYRMRIFAEVCEEVLEAV